MTAGMTEFIPNHWLINKKRKQQINNQPDG